MQHPRTSRLAARPLVLLVVAVVLTVLGVQDAAAGPVPPSGLGGPVYTGDFPDPSVLRTGGLYVAYGTSNGTAYVPALVSSDLRTWHAAGDALPRPARWGVRLAGRGAYPQEVWAPGVAQVGRSYVMYYSLRAGAEPRRTCLSVATASSALGPFTDRTTTPLRCDADPAGSIDPQPFTDARGHRYLLWKSEGQAGRTPTRLWSQRLDATGTRFASGTRPALLLTTALAWEQPIVEGPSMVRYGGRYVLFYSAGRWQSAGYSTGYAVCTGPVGPCRRGMEVPLLSSHDRVLGPGGATALLDTSGRLRLVHHCWDGRATGYPQGVRRLGVATLGVDGTGHLRVLSDG